MHKLQELYGILYSCSALAVVNSKAQVAYCSSHRNDQVNSRTGVFQNSGITVASPSKTFQKPHVAIFKSHNGCILPCTAMVLPRMKRLHDSLVKHCGILISLGCVLLLISRKRLISRLLSSYFSRYLPYLAAWLRRPSSPKGRANGANGKLLRPPPVRPEPSGNSGPPSPWVLSPASNARQPGQVRFDPMIAVVPIPSHCDMPPEKRGTAGMGWCWSVINSFLLVESS